MGPQIVTGFLHVLLWENGKLMGDYHGILISHCSQYLVYNQHQPTQILFTNFWNMTNYGNILNIVNNILVLHVGDHSENDDYMRKNEAGSTIIIDVQRQSLQGTQNYGNIWVNIIPGIEKNYMKITIRNKQLHNYIMELAYIISSVCPASSQHQLKD